MPRNYVKKTSGPKYTKDDLKNAVLEVKNGSTIYAASNKFSVPEETVRRWVVKNPSHQGPGRSSYLTKEEEMCIVVALQFLGQCGFPFDRRDVINLVETYLTTNKAAQILFRNGKPGVEWIRGFEKRWKKELSKKKPELLTKARAADLNEETATVFFNTYEKLLYDNGLQDEPDRIFNLDEAGLSTDPRSTKVFFKKNQRTAYMKSADCGKAMYTVLFCISAAGVYLPPFVVYKGQHLYQSWTAGGPPKTIYGCSDSGWMHDTLFESWMAHFIDFVKNRKKPVLLLYDGHGSHLTYNTIKQAMENGVIILCLPPNCSHALQPLDVRVFSPMKKDWKEILKHWFRESRLQNVSKASFPFLLKKLFERMKLENAVNAFKGAGLYPLNRKAIQHRILITEKRNNQEHTRTDSSTSIVSSEAVSLDSPLKNLKKAILQTLSPTPSVNTVLAIENSKKKRKRVQSKSGEVLTNENVLERLAVEESDRKKKISQANIEKDVKNAENFQEIKQGPSSKKKRKRVQSKSGEVITNKKVLERLAVQESDHKKKFSQANIEEGIKNAEDCKEIKQGSWVEVEYQSRSQSSKFIGQVIEINEFYHIKYLTKSPLGDYYTFPAIDDEDCVEFSDICRILSEPNFDSRGHYFFN